MSRKKTQLSREKIGAAALALADAEGFQAVSMRRVAQELDVGTMSLYYYVKTKDDLVAVMDDALMGEVLLPSLPKDWRPPSWRLRAGRDLCSCVIRGHWFPCCRRRRG